MNSYLWSQGLGETDKDICIINGQMSFYEASSEQVDMMRIINNPSFKPQNIQMDGTSQAFKVKTRKNWLYISGNYHETDNCGRPRLYIFVTESCDLDGVKQTLNNYAGQMKCTLYDADMAAIEKYFSQKRKNRIISLSTLAIVATALAIAYLIHINA